MLLTTDHTFQTSCGEHTITIYAASDIPVKGYLYYIHGGGLLYGSRRDLPAYHISEMTQAGFAIIAFDYVLAPEHHLSQITEDLMCQINYMLSHQIALSPDGEITISPCETEIPYFLWGRSSGAYLSLLLASGVISPDLTLLRAPAGILSWYGYGFLTDEWFQTPSRHYLTYPPVPEQCITHLCDVSKTNRPLEQYYSLYVYARQKGLWKDLIYSGRDKFFYLNYSLRACDRLPCPLFCAHSVSDPDVPYGEFRALSEKYRAATMIASVPEHDFDRNTAHTVTATLLQKSIAFLCAHSGS